MPRWHPAAASLWAWASIKRIWQTPARIGINRSVVVDRGLVTSRSPRSAGLLQKDGRRVPKGAGRRGAEAVILAKLES